MTKAPTEACTVASISRMLIFSALVFPLAAASVPAIAGTNIQMLPPVTENTTTVCPAGTPHMLTWDGSTPLSCSNELTVSGGNVGIGTQGPQATLDVNGEVRVGDSGAACSAANKGAIRYDATAVLFEGCDGSSWRSLGGGSVGKLYWDGNWAGNTYWCDPGYHVAFFHFDCGCSNNASWFECQAN